MLAPSTRWLLLIPPLVGLIMAITVLVDDGDAATTRVSPPVAVGAAGPGPEDDPPAVRSARLADLEAPDAAEPVAIRIPALEIDHPVVGVGVDEATGEMAVPEDVVSVGWYRHGAVPGGPGSAVLAAHVDTYRDGAGAFFFLRDADPGDPVEVDLADGRRLAYEVVGIERYPRDGLPLAELFDRAGPGRLALVTCGGEFDDRTRRYADNVVVYAAAAGESVQ